MLSSTDTDDANDAMDNGAKRVAPAKSEIAFPYAHLEDAVSLVRAVAENGAYLTRDQTAAAMGVSSGSGSFSWKVGAARMFRLIETSGGKYHLSDLGARIISSDESEARTARREAFLNIELYQKAYEHFRGRSLPTRPDGLENAFLTFGVPPKQKDKARLAFERSAQFAGFFHAGKDRLVEPIIPDSAGSIGRSAREDAAVNNSSDRSLPGAARDDLIIGMLKRLPPTDKPWPVRDRARWLRTFADNLAIIYPTDPPDSEEITVSLTVNKQSVERTSQSVAPVPQRRVPESKQAPSAGPSWDTARRQSASDLDDEIPF